MMFVWLLTTSTPVLFSSGLKPVLGNSNVFQIGREEEAVLWIETLEGRETSKEFQEIYRDVDILSHKFGTLCLDIRKKFSAYPFLYKSHLGEILWINSDRINSQKNNANPFGGCQILISDSEEFKFELADLYEDQEFYRLNKIHLYWNLKPTKS
jgi:hypothetical protein